MEVQTPLPIPEANINEPTLASYTDFREYLRDFFDYKLNLHRNSFSQYSYKIFSAAADIKSPNYLKLIIDGERNLSEVTARKFAKALGLDKEGTEEFWLLVEYGQALDPLERNRRLQTLNEFRARRRMKMSDVSHRPAEQVNHWVSYVLHALADQSDVDFSIEGLRDHLMGKVNVEDIRKNLQQLFNSGALQVDPETGKVKKGIVAPSQDEVSPEQVRKIQSELMYLGMESVLNGKTHEREVGTVTMCLTESEFEKIKFELRHLRKRILKDIMIARSQSPGDRVYQFNIQLFPITKKSAKKRNF